MEGSSTKPQYFQFCLLCVVEVGWACLLSNSDDVNKFQSLRSYLGQGRSYPSRLISAQTLFRQSANHDLVSIFHHDNFIYHSGQLDRIIP